jgi:hypothetical protein
MALATRSALLAIFVAALAVPGCSVAGQKESRMSEAKAAVRLECVGRFCLEVPAEFARKGEAYRFGRVELVEVALPEPGEKGFQALWAARLAKIAALRKSERRPDAPTGSIVERRSLQADFEVVMYHHNGIQKDGSMTGLLARDGRGLALEKILSFTFRDDVLDRFQTIGKAWHPRREGEPWPIPGKNAFYLGTSTLVEPAYGGEKAYARFETEDGATKIEVTTESQVEPEKKGILESIGEAAVRAGVGVSGLMRTVRNGKRKAAGEKGEELILKVDDGKTLSFTWTFLGGKEDSDRPRIDIELETSSEHEKEKLVMWDRLLDSLRRADAK